MEKKKKIEIRYPPPVSALIISTNFKLCDLEL